MNKRKRFSSFNLRDALALTQVQTVHPWVMDAPSKLPSNHYQQTMDKLNQHFDLSLSESAKVLWIDMILLEALNAFDGLKIWKEASLQTQQLTGVVDYLIAPQAVVYQQPLLCVVEAKKDNFEKGMAQCLVEMYACQQLNQQDFAVYGIVTNAVNWEFYKLSASQQLYKTVAYSEAHLEEILGILNWIFAQCLENQSQIKT